MHGHSYYYNKINILSSLVNSSDAELCDILQDLARTPSERSIAQDLRNRINRSLSATSSVSMFSRSSKHGITSNTNVLTQELTPKERNKGSPFSDVELFSEASHDGHFEQKSNVSYTSIEAGHTAIDGDEHTLVPPTEHDMSFSHFLSPFSDSGNSVSAGPAGATDAAGLSQRERLQLIQLCREGDSSESAESAEEEIEEEVSMSQPFWDRYFSSEDEMEGESMEPPWEDSIPQLDGAFDHGKSSSKKKRKRLGLVSSRKRHACSQQSDKGNAVDQKVVKGNTLSCNLRSRASSLTRKRKSPHKSQESVSERPRQRSLPLELSVVREKWSPMHKAVHSETRECIAKPTLSCRLKERALSQTLFPLIEKLPYSSCSRTHTRGPADKEGVLLADCTSQTPSPKLLEELSTEEEEDDEFCLAFSTSESESELTQREHHSKPQGAI